jgi:serine/threonine protein kinase
VSIEGNEIGNPRQQVGRYTIFHQIAAGGMATVHLARFAGPAGFSRVVAVKHLHPHLCADPEFRAMFIDEARLVSRIRHPNVVPTLDVVVNDTEIFLVMEYIQGDALSSLRRAARQQQQDIPLAVCSAVIVGALQGLHAAHEARSESGELLDLVHRDVSPPNILVGVDGVPLVLDFGVAKAMQAHHETRPGMVKGKSSYMSPEQIRGEPVTRAADIFAAAVVLWELLTTRRLFSGTNEHERIYKVLQGAELTPPSTMAARIPAGLDEVVMRGLRPNPSERYRTALEMAEAIEQKIPPASQRVVGEWVARTASESLNRRAEFLRQIEISDIIVPALETGKPGRTTGRTTGSTTGRTGKTGRTSYPVTAETASHATVYAGVPVAAARARTKLPLWRDRRAVVGGAGAALLVAVTIVIASRGPTFSPPPSFATAPGGRPSVGTTVIMKSAFSPPPRPASAPATVPEGLVLAPAPPPPAPPLAPPAGPATPTLARGGQRAGEREGADGDGGHAVDNRRAPALAAKPAHDHNLVRRAVSSAARPPARARAPVAATTAAATVAEDPALLPRPTEVPRVPLAPTRDLKKRVPLVDDQPRVQILE